MAASTETMQAIGISKFTTPSGYELMTVPRPTITKPDELIIKVHSASVNPVDVKKANGIFKMALKDEFPYIIGYDVAGTVVEVGTDVQTLKAGDEVYARLPEIHRGSWAEYAKSTEAFIALKPTNMSFNEAASLPLAAVTALQAFNQYTGSLEGKTVFIPAGLSGTGAYACQIAKNVFKAGKVITTVSTSKVPLVPKLLGDNVVDQIIDYTKEDVLKAIEPRSIDFVFDTMGQAMDFLPLMAEKDSFIVSISTLPSGKTLQNAPILRGAADPSVPFVARAFLDAGDAYRRWRASRFGVTYMYIFLDPNAKDLDKMSKFAEEGKIKAVVGTAVPMKQFGKVIEALEVVYNGKGGLGKTVFEMV